MSNGEGRGPTMPVPAAPESQRRLTREDRMIARPGRVLPSVGFYAVLLTLVATRGWAITDNFTRPAGTDIGPAWTEVVNDWRLEAGALRSPGIDSNSVALYAARN